MRKLVSIVLLLLIGLPMMASYHLYTNRSVLSEGKWVKIRVSESGVCRMSFNELRNAGIEPEQVRVYGFGGAQLTQNFLQKKIDDLPQVPVFKGTDYVLFWVQGPISWEYDAAKRRFVHTQNTYSKYGYYFLTDNVGEPLALTESAAITGDATDVTSYLNIQVHDFDTINLVDRGGVSGGGRTFYGEQFNGNVSMTFPFETPDALTEEQSSAHVEVAAFASAPSYFYSSLNNSNERNVYIRAVPDHYTMGCTGSLELSENSQADRQQVVLRLEGTTSGVIGWLNYIELSTPSALRMRGSWLPVRSTVNHETPIPVRYHMSGGDANTQIWDITHPEAIKKMPTTLTNGELTWTCSQEEEIKEFVAVNTNGSAFVSAEVVGDVSNQNLHQLKNIDYVIICPEGYETIAEDLAKAHEAKEAITWAVVTDKQVYNEFSSGTPDATAYRWLMKMLYDRANDDSSIARPRWLLLMGHGSFDNRNILSTSKGSSTSGVKLLLTYQSINSENEVYAYATDDYFGFLDDNEGESDIHGRMDIGVGRLPVYSVSEARTTVDKLITYIRNEQVGKWKNQLVYLADDGEHGQHTKTAEASAEKVRLKNPDFVVHKIYLDAYPQEVNASGESYPLAKNKIQNLLKSGVLFFDYSGHGGYNAITSESVMNIKDIEKMSNRNQAFWLFATCNFGQFDSGLRSSAEAAVLNPNGGAIGVLAATRTVYASPNTELNRSVTDTLFGHKDVFHYDMTLGEAVAIGKNRLGSETNKMAYVLIGDPAMRLNYPTDYQVHTTSTVDTLHALSVQRIEGNIIDEDSMVVDFNGKMDITVYDKLQVITTRDNDDQTDEAEYVDYNDYPNTIFSGKTEVKKGKFAFTFMVPKDIRYNYGNGRIVYYAVDTTDAGEQAEAVGHFEKFIVGGTGNILSADTAGPDMKIYLNTKSFKNGDRSYATPRFFAELNDSNGINTAGAGIGHDLLLIVDDDPKMIYSLNEYFTASDNSYQTGMVSYLMEKLSDGPHFLTFRAWDMLNNSTTQSLNFIIDSHMSPSICSVVTYPNPVPQAGILNLAVDYDQPDELLQTEVYLYNTSGQIVYSHIQDNPDDVVTINLAQLGLTPGIYVYSVKIKSVSSNYSTTSGKIIVYRL